MRVRFLAEAEAEVDEAVDWYAGRDDTGDLADDFLDEVTRVRQLVESVPTRGPSSSQEYGGWYCAGFRIRSSTS